MVAGDACNQQGTLCDLGDDCNVRLLCDDEDPRAGPCPRSSRTVKSEVRYLSKTERDRLAKQVFETPLATWRYREGSGQRHFGVVIEDGLPPEALRASGDQVDLYGYASLAMAAIQMQQEQIALLRAEIDALKKASTRRNEEPDHAQDTREPGGAAR
jgi:hypothetical protein